METYRQRTQRVIDAIHLREPDRVPVMLPTFNFPIYNAGGTAMPEHNLTMEELDSYISSG